MITGIVALVSGAVYMALAHSFLEGLSPQYWLLFTLGMLAASLAFSADSCSQKIRERCPFGLLTTGFALLVLVLPHFQRKGSQIPQFDWHLFLAEVLMGLAASCFLVAVSQQRRHPVRSFLESRPIVWLGTFAYSLYLVHAPLIQVVWQYMVNPLHLSAVKAFSLLVLLGLPLVVGISYIFFLIAEKPFIGYQKLQER